MSDIKRYLERLLSAHNIVVNSSRNEMFEHFALDEENIGIVKRIIESQKIMVDKWILKNRITDIIQSSVRIPNATIGKFYEAKIDFTELGWNHIIFAEFEGLEDHGFAYDFESTTISGNPVEKGDVKIHLKFRVEGEPEDSELNTKPIAFYVNADPKSLWANKPSDESDLFWKEDNAQDFKPLGDKHIVVASKRGRSHANVGAFREDDYAFKHISNLGWNVVAVSDGAGSAKYSRKGSQIACQTVIDYFDTVFDAKNSEDLDTLVKSLNLNGNLTTGASENAEIEIGKVANNYLGDCAKFVHSGLEKFAGENQLDIEELHSTLIFTLFKKYDFGYVVLTFGVGDCPIGIVNKDQTEFKLMNWLDVGEFGGGTRFITMSDIFVNEKFATRFSCKIIDDFSFLMLMTDGIYDAKFVVEANLEKLESWKAFISDLQGNNDDKAKVDFKTDNVEIANQLSAWMDFWSPGNHDDRTLAIVF